jgi:hypothetical protein
MRRQAGGGYYIMGLADVTGTARVIAFWKMGARIMGKWRGWNGLRMNLAAGFDCGVVNFKFRGAQRLTQRAQRAQRSLVGCGLGGGQKWLAIWAAGAVSSGCSLQEEGFAAVAAVHQRKSGARSGGGSFRGVQESRLHCWPLSTRSAAMPGSPFLQV